MFKWFQKKKQKRKIKLIKEYLTIINIINLLIKKIENIKINFIEITFYLKDTNLFFYNLNQYNLENNEKKYSFQTKEEAINFLEESQAKYEEKMNKISNKNNKKYQNLIPLNEEIEINQSEELSLAKMIKNPITLKNKNNDLIKINFIEITFYLKDTNLFFYNLNQYNLENNEKKYSFQTKEEAINFLEESQAKYEEKMNKISNKNNKKYQNLIPLNEEIEINQSEELSLAKMIKNPITLKNKNNDLIKINLNDPIDNNIDANLLIAKSETDSNNDLQLSNEQAKTITLSSYVYHDSTPSLSQQHLSFSSTENLINEDTDHLTKKDLTSKIKKYYIF